MASTYSDSLRLELIATGEQSGTWGVTTNTNLGTLLEAAIAGVATVTHDDTASYTLTTANGADDEARHMTLVIGGTLTADRNVVCPAEHKLYVVKNSTSGGFAITIKTSGGTGVEVPSGQTTIVYCDGTNVVSALSTFQGCWAYRSTDQSIPNVTSANVQFNAEHYDTSAIHSTVSSTHLFTVPNGWRKATFGCAVSYGSSGTGNRTMQIFKDGSTTVHIDGKIGQSATGQTFTALLGAYPVSGGDTFHVEFFQSSGGSLSLTQDVTYAFLLRAD